MTTILAGSFRYRKLIPALGGQSFEGSGNYNGGYFLRLLANMDLRWAAAPMSAYSLATMLPKEDP